MFLSRRFLLRSFHCKYVQNVTFESFLSERDSPYQSRRLFSTGNDSGDEDTKSTPRIPKRFLKKLSKLNEDGKKYELVYGRPKVDLDGDHEEMGADHQNLSAEKMLSESVTQYEQIPADFPSDKETYRQWKRQSQSSKAYRPNVDPTSTSIFLFQGQGSQFVGMGENLLPYPGVRQLYERASTVLGYDLLDLCLKGPQKKLDKTEYCQPAILVTSIAALIKLKELFPKAEESCVGVAGFSVGELAALVFADVLTFEDAVSLVKLRGEEMQLASEETPSGMMTVLLHHDTKLGFALHAASEYCRLKLHMHNPVCRVANYLYPECKVVAGNNEALEFLEQNAKDFGIRRLKRLPVSGAFHTELMEPAKIPFRAKLKQISLSQPSKPVHKNVDAKRYGSVSTIYHQLPRQIIKPVKWEQILHVIYSREQGTPFPHTYEIGPGKHLSAILRKVNAKACETLHQIDV